MSALTVTSSPAATRAIELRESRTLDRPPSCIRFCQAHPEYIVVGTYELQKESQESVEGDGPLEDEETQASAEKEDDVACSQESTSAKAPQSRNGSLIVFRLLNDTLQLVDTLSTPSAIFDLTFHPHAGRRDLLGAVTSTGSLITARLRPDMDSARPLEILSISEIEGVGEGVLFTSLAWHPKKWNVAAITTSSGHVYLVSLDEATLSIKLSQQLPLMSQFESWCVAMWPPGAAKDQEQHTIYTGADDGVLRYTSLAMLSDDAKLLEEEDKALSSIKRGDAEEARDTPLWEQSYTEGPGAIAHVRFSQHMVKNVHNAGVTAILPLPAYDPNRAIIVTGSYDDRIRVLLVPHPHKVTFCYTPQVLFEQSLGGGVWELHLFGFRRILPADGGPATIADILVSCMQAGPRIVRLRMRDLDVEMDVLHEFGGHDLNYASHYRTVEAGELDIVTTSFYDKKLHLWARTQTKSSSKDEKNPG